MNKNQEIWTTLDQLNRKVESTRTELRGRAEFVQRSLSDLVAALDAKEDDRVNSLGAIQRTGQEVDMLCARLAALREAIEVAKRSIRQEVA